MTSKRSLYARPLYDRGAFKPKRETRPRVTRRARTGSGWNAFLRGVCYAGILLAAWKLILAWLVTS